MLGSKYFLTKMPLNSSLLSDSIHSEYILSANFMTYTAIPSVKGQITIPSEIRAKYHIGKDTPVVIEDQGKGVITMKIMQMIDHDSVEFYEDEGGFGLNFKKPIDPQVLIDAIKKIDG